MATTKAVWERVGEGSAADQVTADYTDDGHILDDRDAPCPKCAYQRLPLPGWVRPGVAFAVQGVAYRVVTVGSTNHGTPGAGRHFRDIVHAERLEDARWELPPSESPVVEIQDSLQGLFEMPTFDAAALRSAIRMQEQTMVTDHPVPVDDVRKTVTYAKVLGRTVRSRRELHGVSLEQIAEAAGCSISAWSRVETGVTVMTVTQLWHAAVALGVEPWTLVKQADESAGQLAEDGVALSAPPRGSRRPRT